MDIANEKQSFFSGWVEFQTEKEVIDEFYNTIQTNDYEVFWDVGAYRGLYTLIASETIPFTYAFEPAPIPRQNLHENCSHFDITNYKTITTPLFNKTEQQELTIDTTSGSRTFIKGTSTLPERDTSKTVTKLVKRPDELIKTTTISPPDILKIDIEGAEFEVLNGFGDYLQNISTIFVEIHLSKKKNNSVSEYLESNGFSITTLLTRKQSDEDYQKFIKAENTNSS